jgi:hypothetical protein
MDATKRAPDTAGQEVAVNLLNVVEQFPAGIGSKPCQIIAESSSRLLKEAV